MLEQLIVAEQRLVLLEKEYGPEHAEVIKCKAMADDLHSKIKNRVNGIMDGLEARVLSLKNSLENLEMEVALATTNDVNQSRPKPALFRGQTQSGRTATFPPDPRHEDRVREDRRRSAQDHDGRNRGQG